MDCFPDDILTQILFKLHCSKSILRCTSVCKPWCSLIKSPLFINLHLSRPDRPKFLLCDYNLRLDGCYMACCLSVVYDTETLVEHNRLVCGNYLGYGMSIHGCCNGLVCYTKSSDGVTYVWNPNIRKQKALPRFRDHGNGNACCGFWFDNRVNDYMVARIEGLSFGVYSLSSNSWETVGVEIPLNLVDGIRELVHVDGMLHWPALSSSVWMICSLDVESGLLRQTALTDTMSVSSRGDKYFSLKPLDEQSFAAFESKPVPVCEAWRCCMVHVYDQNVNKLYTIDLEMDTHHKLHHMAGLRNNGEALFTKLDLNDSGIISWNTKTKEIKEFAPEVTVTKELALTGSSANAYYRLTRVRPFVESLVLLNDGDAERISTPNYHLTSKSNFARFIWLAFLGLFSLIVFLICFSSILY